MTGKIEWFFVIILTIYKIKRIISIVSQNTVLTFPIRELIRITCWDKFLWVFLTFPIRELILYAFKNRLGYNMVCFNLPFPYGNWYIKFYFISFDNTLPFPYGNLFQTQKSLLTIKKWAGILFYLLYFNFLRMIVTAK